MSRDAYHYIAKQASVGAPLAFAFHGTGGDEHQFTSLVHQASPEAASPRRAATSLNMALTASSVARRKVVYDMADLVVRAKKMAGLHSCASRGTRRRGVYGVGYSNGATILAAVIFRAPDLFDGVVLMHH